jgi:adenosylcobinamide kinase / adenosylcobinamide-phosphate guanylyltransferase
MSMCHFILGGVRSGKSREAQAWAQQAEREGFAVRVLVTAIAADDEMRARIALHRASRPAGWPTVEVPLSADGLAKAIAGYATPNSCLLIDCLTLWLSQLLCPPAGFAALSETAAHDACDRLVLTLAQAPGRIVVVGNEIGQGVMPIDAASRRVVDALGRLQQQVAARSERVTWMVAGLPLAVKPR